MNLFGFVFNNPINDFDILGLIRKRQTFWGAAGFYAGAALVSFGLGAASPVIGIAAIVVGATGVALGAINVGNGLTETGSKNVPNNLPGLLGKCLDDKVHPYRNTEIPGPYQWAGTIVGVGLNQIPKVVTISAAVPKMISTSVSPPSPITLPPAPLPKPYY